jgi:hypothetical protein
LAKRIAPGLLQQHWVHSHEEDTDREMVFRPKSFQFPPSRGRSSFALGSDGTLLEGGPGPGDRGEESAGTWKLEDEDKLVFFRGSQATPMRTLRVKSATKDRLVIHKE